MKMDPSPNVSLMDEKVRRIASHVLPIRNGETPRTNRVEPRPGFEKRGLEKSIPANLCRERSR